MRFALLRQSAFTMIETLLVLFVIGIVTMASILHYRHIEAHARLINLHDNAQVLMMALNEYYHLTPCAMGTDDQHGVFPAANTNVNLYSGGQLVAAGVLQSNLLHSGNGVSSMSAEVYYDTVNKPIDAATEKPVYQLEVSFTFAAAVPEALVAYYAGILHAQLDATNPRILFWRQLPGHVSIVDAKSPLWVSQGYRNLFKQQENSISSKTGSVESCLS